MIDIAPFKQSDDSLCGPACVKMVLKFYGIEASEQELAQKCNHTYELGCDDAGMKAAFESYGLKVMIKNFATFEDIEKYIDFAIPVLVDWFSPGIKLGLHEGPEGHSSIVVHLDSEYIYLMDPEIAGIRKMPRNEFMRCWFDWRSQYIVSWQDMVIRQIMVAYR